MPEEFSTVTTNDYSAPPQDSPVAEFLRIARKRFHSAAEAEEPVRKDALDDFKFRSGDQWPQDIKIQRSKDGRPCLEMDQIEKFVRQVCNEERQQRPSIQVNPVGDGADVETAEIEQGLIRHIEVQSHADVPRDHAFEMMVTGGFGYYRLLVAEDELTGELEIYIKRIKNPFSVYFMTGCLEPDYSDARWAFIIQDLDKDEYKLEYPESSMASLLDWASVGDNAPEWVTKDSIRIAEYFYVEGKGPDRKVKWAKINAVECLEGGPGNEVEWQGKWIPILAVLGVDLDINGRRFLAGMVRKLKDPQRQYNYMNSAATEAIALAPKAPWVAAEGQLENHETEWKQSNQRNFAVLQYKPTGVNGSPAPPPQRMAVEPPIQAMMEMVRQANEDLQGAAGIYNPSLGAPSADSSGKAVLARQKQSDITNLNWTDNLARTIRFEGKQLLDLIPKIYTEPKIRRIINPDGTVKHVGVANSANGGMDAAAAAHMLEIPKIYDIGVGNYDVTISVGPNYQSKRQEAVGAELAFMQAVPMAAEVAPDLVAGDMDWPGAKEFQKRLKLAVGAKYPFLFAGDQDGQTQGEQLQAQVQQMTAVIQQQHQILQQQHEALQGKMLEQQTKVQVAKMQAETSITIAEINTKAQDLNQRLEFVGDMLQKLTDQQHELGMAAADHQHTIAEQDQAHQQVLTQTAQQQAGDQQSQASDQQFQAQQAAQEPAAEGGE